MDWQQIAALAIVTTTAAVFLWQRLRRRKFDFRRDTHCGCSAPGGAGAQSSIVFHARKGERPTIVAKMK